MISWSDRKKSFAAKFWWFGIIFAVLLGIGLLTIFGTSVPKTLIFHSDIGTFVPFRATERSIMIENPGRRLITIKEVHTCCGISLPYGFPKTIHPQSTAAMVVRVHGSDSPLEKAITLKTDDPAHSVVKCVIRGNPDYSVPYAPGYVMTGKVVAGQKIASVWKIFKGNGPELACNVFSSSKYITPVVQEIDQHGNVEIGIKVSTDAPRGKLAGFLFGITGVEACPTFTARFETEIARGLWPHPENIFFGRVNDKAVVSRSIDLEVIESGWNTVEVDRPSEECLNTQIIRVGQNKYKLHVSLNPEKMPQILNTVLTLHDHNGDSLQIPVIAAQSTTTKTTEMAAKQGH